MTTISSPKNFNRATIGSVIEKELRRQFTYYLRAIGIEHMACCPSCGIVCRFPVDFYTTTINGKESRASPCRTCMQKRQFIVSWKRKGWPEEDMEIAWQRSRARIAVKNGKEAAVAPPKILNKRDEIPKPTIEGKIEAKPSGKIKLTTKTDLMEKAKLLLAKKEKTKQKKLSNTGSTSTVKVADKPKSSNKTTVKGKSAKGAKKTPPVAGAKRPKVLEGVNMSVKKIKKPMTVINKDENKLAAQAALIASKRDDPRIRESKPNAPKKVDLRYMTRFKTPNVRKRAEITTEEAEKVMNLEELV